MKTIVRVEHDNGIGMFFQSWTEDHHLMHVAPQISDRHQDFNTPEEDRLWLNKDGKKWFCAYKSLDQFRQWVKDYEVKRLIEAGYKVLLLKVTEYQEGEHQVIFTKESITSSENMTEIFK